MRIDTWSACLNRFIELKEKHQLATPFAGYTSPNFHSAKTRILYVGKATFGNFEREKFDKVASGEPGEALRVSQDICRGVFESNRDHGGATFWGFANDLANRLNGASALDSLSWTNLCRLGSSKDNPDAYLIQGQLHESARALREDIVDLKPNLVVFVSNNFAKEVMMAAMDHPRDDSWDMSDKNPDPSVRDVWSKTSTKQYPAFLWMRHPQFSKSSLRTFALDKAEELVG